MKKFIYTIIAAIFFLGLSSGISFSGPEYFGCLPQDETYNAANFDGDTRHCVSQDDIYDYLHLLDTDDDGDIDTLDASIAGVTSRYETIYIDAGAMVPNTTNGAQSGTKEYVTNDLDLDYMAFDTTTEEYVTFKFPMPETWNRGTIKAKFYWTAADDTGDVGNTVEWEIGCVAISNADTIDANAYAASQVASDALLTGESATMHLTAATPAITVQGTPASGDMIICKCSRNVGGTDNMALDAWLSGVWVQYLANVTATAW